MQEILFYIFSALTLLCGLLVVFNPFSRNPVTSAMFLVLTIITCPASLSFLRPSSSPPCKSSSTPAPSSCCSYS